MKARARTLLLLASLALLLGGLVAWALLGVERPDEAARARHDREARALPFRPGDVTLLEIAPRGVPQVRWTRVEGGWRAEPSGAAARAEVVDGLLERLAEMRVRVVLPAGEGGLASRGLDPPASRVALTLRDGSTRALDLGDENGFDRTRNARRGGEILLVEGVPSVLFDPAPDRAIAAP
ncbi:MAG: DUF4340 domain-containing protein [Deltaproteobacteria bacterium]